MRRLLPYLTIGLTLCLCAQVLFWFEIGGRGVQMWPFLWAYSRAAMVDLCIGSKNLTGTTIAWSFAYVALALGLWVGIEVIREPRSHRTWTRAVAGWAVAEAGLMVLGWVLFALGLLDME